jgi:hypothetical protein
MPRKRGKSNRKERKERKEGKVKEIRNQMTELERDSPQYFSSLSYVFFAFYAVSPFLLYAAAQAMRGRYIRTVVPRPGSLSIFKRPPERATI